MARTLVAMFILALASAACASGSAGNAYFPLGAGNRWTLEAEDGGRPATISIAQASSDVLVLRGLPGTRELHVRTVGRTIEAWDDGQHRWEALLRLGARAGTKYTVNLSGLSLWRNVQVTVASRTAVVHDARDRTFRNCVRLTFRYPKGLVDAGLEELVFAPEVGIVRTSVQTIAGPRVSVLRSYRLT
ncbi:MAG: hypothetical protein MSC30_13625 [Gaiellaceae bacterium MAG52_C11]|nr:hypothetical protein [Candidatus Gaiellasilicea maunaloa]